MIIYEDQCRECAAPGYPCLGDACKYRRVPVPYCDDCGEEITGDIFEDAVDDILCEDCLKDRHRKVII